MAFTKPPQPPQPIAPRQPKPKRQQETDLFGGDSRVVETMVSLAAPHVHRGRRRHSPHDSRSDAAQPIHRTVQDTGEAVTRLRATDVHHRSGRVTDRKGAECA